MKTIVFFHVSKYLNYNENENEILYLMNLSSILEKKNYRTEIIDISNIKYEKGTVEFFSKNADIVLFCGNNRIIMKECVNEIFNKNIKFAAIGEQVFLNYETLKINTGISKLLFGYSEKCIEEYLNGNLNHVIELDNIKELPEPALIELKKIDIPNRQRVSHHALYYDENMPGSKDIFGRNTALIHLTQGIKNNELSKMYQNTVFFRSIDSLFSEVELLKIKYGITSLSFIDREFLIDITIVEKLIKRLSKEFNITFRFKTSKKIDNDLSKFLLLNGWINLDNN